MVTNLPLTSPSAHETCDTIVNSVKTSNLHFILQETPNSVYITIRKKYVSEVFSTKKNHENERNQMSLSQENAYYKLKDEF